MLKNALIASALLAAAAVDARAITIDTVPVRNAGNAGDVQSQGTFGGVAHYYRIGTTEVTNAQYAAFLTEKAKSDPLALYNTSMGSNARGGITRDGVSGSYSYAVKPNMGDKPVNYVSWYDSIRFANWLHNDQGAGDTESGAYTLLGNAPTPTNDLSIARSSGAKWFLPSENEWYKSAYHLNDGATGNYFDYPTKSFVVPVSEAPPGGSNSANYNFVVGDSTLVGAYTDSDSPYGTFDQGGNVFEWNETLIGSTRGLRGGSWLVNASYTNASFRGESNAAEEFDHFGFRVAFVPEPSSFIIAALGAVGLIAWRRRKGK